MVVLDITQVPCFATTNKIKGQITAKVQYLYQTSYYTNLETS